MNALAVHPSEQPLLDPAGATMGPPPMASHDGLAPSVDREPEEVYAVSSAGSEHLGGDPSLDSVLSGMWEGVAAHRSVVCPLCDGELRPIYGAHHRPIGGRCRGCATTVS